MSRQAEGRDISVNTTQIRTKRSNAAADEQHPGDENYTRFIILIAGPVVVAVLATSGLSTDDTAQVMRSVELQIPFVKIDELVPSVVGCEHGKDNGLLMSSIYF